MKCIILQDIFLQLLLSFSSLKNSKQVSFYFIATLAFIPLASPASSSASESCTKLECKRRFTYSKYGADFLVSCMTIKLDDYSDTDHKMIPSNTDYNTCHCTVHTARKGGVPIDIPWYATRLKDHYYLFPISPDSDKYVDTNGNECTPEKEGVSGDFNGSANVDIPEVSLK